MNGFETIAVSSIAGISSLVEHRYDTIEDALNEGKIVVLAAGHICLFHDGHCCRCQGGRNRRRCFDKGTKVDGVYDKDPKTNGDATKIDKTTFSEAIERVRNHGHRSLLDLPKIWIIR